MVKSLRKTSPRRSERSGLLFIGDPHVESRQPGFRKDDYQRVILREIEMVSRLRQSTQSAARVFGRPVR